MSGGEIFVPKIPSYRLPDLVKAFSKNAIIKIIGIRPGEKIHEEMITMHDSPNSIECKNFYVIYPNEQLKKIGLLKLKGKACMVNYRYSSDQNKEFLNISELRTLIKEIS